MSMTKGTVLADLIKIIVLSAIGFVGWISTMSFSNKGRIIKLESDYTHIVTGINEIKAAVIKPVERRRD